MAGALHNASAMDSEHSDHQTPAADFATGAYADPFGTLEEFTLDPGCTRGVAIDSLEPGTHVIVGTSHSCYRFVIDDPRHRCATVTGGKMFADPTEVRIDGSTAGGSVIKAGWIGVGMRMELTAGLKRVTTSWVKFLAVDRVQVAA
jgi:hypothetical protein